MAKGRLYDWAYCNHMSPLKSEHFLWLVAEGEVREIGSVRAGRGIAV